MGGDDPFYVVSNEGLDLRQIFDILMRGKWLILAAVLAVTVPVAIYSLLQPSMYSSYALLLVEKQDTDLASILPSDPSAAFFRNERNLSNELLILRQSLPLAETVAQQLMDLERVPGTDRPLTILEPLEDGAPPTARDVAFRLQIDYVQASMTTNDADAISITAVSTDPQEAALIANAYSTAFASLTREENQEGYATSREFLQEQVAERGQALDSLDQAVQAYMEREDAVALNEETSQTVQQIGNLTAERDGAGIEIQTVRARIAALQAELQQLEPNLSDRLGSGLDAELATAQTRVQELIAELEVYYNRQPDLRSATTVPAEVERLRNQLASARERSREISDQLSSQSLAASSGPGDPNSGFVRAAALRSQISDLRVQLNGLTAQRNQLSSRLGQYEADLRAIPGQSIELAQLQRDRQAAEQLYGALQANLQQATVAEQSQLGYAKLIRQAFPSPFPYAPKRLRNIALGLLLGLMFGAVAAIGKVRLDHRLNLPDDIRERGHPLIGTIPSTTELIARDFGGQETMAVNGREVDTHLVTLLNPMAAASEAYRALRTSVQFSRPDVVVETVLVTSANPSEGKSVTSANLAIVMAQAGRKTLLIDADLRKPTGHKKFGLPREPGLVQRLFSEEPFTVDGLHHLADDLWVLTAGSLAPNPSELLGSKRMRELMEEMKQHFDLIIFDAPPVLAATDAVLLSTQCDATLVVTRAGQTRDYELDSALEALSGVGAPVIGTVLNGFDVTKSYGYRYKYAYRYGSDYAYGSDKA
ncbi:MAG: polysaccharide biosynthesis tyrosine autokinase [Rubricoccaceae bacterium]